MKPKSIAAIVLVIGAGVFASYLVFKNSLPEITSATDANNPQKSALGNVSGQVPIQWINKIGSSIANIADSSSSVTTGVNANNSFGGSNNQNLTQSLAQSLFNQMQSQDQSGKQPLQQFNPADPTNQQFIAQATNSLSPDYFFNQNVNASDLKVSNDNSKQAKMNYMDSIKTISSNRFNDPKYIRSADQVESDIQLDCFGGSGTSGNQALADVYKNLVGDYLNLPVPSDWLDLHREIISSLKASNAIYQALANCSTDPVRGYLAAKSLPQLFDEAKAVQDLLAQKYNEIQ